MIEYKMIDVIGASKFGETLSLMEKQGWIPWANHVVYTVEKEVHFTLLVMKPISK